MSDSRADVLDPDIPSPSVNIGIRLGQLRQQHGWTLEQASKHTGVSASALSKIERNELSPTIATLQRIARGYDIYLAALLDEREATRSLPGRRSVTRANGGRPYRSNSCANTLLCSDLLDKRMTPVRTRVTARSPDAYRSWPVPSG